MLRNNADVRRGSYFELGLPVLPRFVCMVLADKLCRRYKRITFTWSGGSLQILLSWKYVLTIFRNFHQRRSALRSKIWCVGFRAIFQFARSASVMSSHVALSSRMPCRFGVTQRFWTNMLVSFWLIYSMFFCWSHPEFNNIHKDFYLADAVHLNLSRQCLLYRSYRGAVLKAVGLLQKNWPITFTRVFSHVW